MAPVLTLHRERKIMEERRIASSARLLGNVRLGEGVYIAQGTIVRSQEDSVQIGHETWVLENSVVIGTAENPADIGSKTVFGHKCLVVGAEIGNLCEIGNGTIFLPGSKVGDMCIFGEGTLVEENQEIPSRSVVMGRPGRVMRQLTDEDEAMIKRMRGGNIELHEGEYMTFSGEQGEDMGKLYPYKDKTPQVAESAYLFETAEVTGDVIIGENCRIASGVKIIGDSHGPVRIGNNVQILENSVLHLLPDNELIIEDDVTIGPGCMIHGTTIGRSSVIESGAILCDNSKLGENTLVKAGSLIPQRKEFEKDAVLEGFPAKEVGKNEGLLERPSWGFLHEKE